MLDFEKYDFGEIKIGPSYFDGLDEDRDFASQERIDIALNPVADDGVYKRSRFSPAETAPMQSLPKAWDVDGFSMD